MRMTIDIDCTPEEARRLFGMPDISSVNDMIVEEMNRKARENLDSLADPERLVDQWMNVGGKGFEQFQQMMQSMSASATTPSKDKK